MVAISVPAATIAPGEIDAQRHPAREWRGDHPIADRGARFGRLGAGGRRTARPAHRGWCWWRNPRCLSSLTRLNCWLALRDTRLRFGKLGALLPRREHRDGLAALDEAAIVEIEPHQPLGDRRGQGHLLIGLGGADRFDPVGEAHRLHRFGPDRRRRAACVRRLPLRRTPSAGRRADRTAAIATRRKWTARARRGPDRATWSRRLKLETPFETDKA